VTSRERPAAHPRREEQSAGIFDRQSPHVAGQREDLDACGPIISGDQIRKGDAFPILFGVPAPRAIEDSLESVSMIEQFLVSDVTLFIPINDPQGPYVGIHSRNRVVQPLSDRHSNRLE
jgi:hypothetical protein